MSQADFDLQLTGLLNPASLYHGQKLNIHQGTNFHAEIEHTFIKLRLPKVIILYNAKTQEAGRIT